MNKNNYFFAPFLIGFILFSGFACSKSNSNSSPNTPPQGGGNGTPQAVISMYNMSFTPSSVTVSKGSVVKWTNDDSTPHTATSNDASTFNSGTVNAGASYSYTTTVAGTFNYHCTIHGTAMSGTLIVTP